MQHKQKRYLTYIHTSVLEPGFGTILQQCLMAGSLNYFFHDIIYLTIVNSNWQQPLIGWYYWYYITLNPNMISNDILELYHKYIYPSNKIVPCLKQNLMATASVVLESCYTRSYSNNTLISFNAMLTELINGEMHFP